MKIRTPQDTDQQMAQAARKLIVEHARSNPHIEEAIWIAAFLSLVADSYHLTGKTHDQYAQSMKEATEFYKSLWDQIE